MIETAQESERRIYPAAHRGRVLPTEVGVPGVSVKVPVANLVKRNNCLSLPGSVLFSARLCFTAH
jgi:hypothetical protein